ncbi:hypothetical protein OG711_12680 [Streptomyces uncialis]|uniref:hypothetical protein n=1 Tax=Streptomyces uncialis TaxID=1048205 RepID=UPI002E300D08|nr:hypothetical protein [Streptomyces uncialis]
MKQRLTADEQDGLFLLLRSLHTILTACQDANCPELRHEAKPDTAPAPGTVLNGIPSPVNRDTPRHSHRYARPPASPTRPSAASGHPHSTGPSHPAPAGRPSGPTHPHHPEAPAHHPADLHQTRADPTTPPGPHAPQHHGVRAPGGHGTTVPAARGPRAAGRDSRPADGSDPDPPGAGRPAPDAASKTAAGPAATGPAAGPTGTRTDEPAADPLPRRDRSGAAARLEALRAAARTEAKAAQGG